MDTRSRKSSKLAKIIIALCILLPALCLTSLYPTIASEVKKEQAEHDEQFADNTETYRNLQENFVNFAMEASYHIYGQMLMENSSESANFAVLDYAGWTNDYYYMMEQARYQASYTVASGTVEKKSDDVLETEETVGILTLMFSADGNLTMVDFKGEEFTNMTSQTLLNLAKESIWQYESNVQAYEEEFLVQVDEKQLVPKNFTIKFAIDDSCDFVDVYSDYYYISTEALLLEVGAVWIIILLAVLVALFALLLPFVKGLQTGWEKLFCMPFELVIVCAMTAFSGAVALFYIMGEISRMVYYPEIQVLGRMVAKEAQFGILMVLNFFGWAACFFLEYIVIASVRQFLCGPVYYLKNRLLIVCILRWIKKQLVRLYDYVTDIDISKKLHGSILKIVIVNFVILTILCCLWVFGIAGLILYSIGLYILLCKYGEKVQKQYNSVLHATEQMAEGDLRISMEEDLGIFQPIGDSLEQVQQGFEKAVQEEAKSQNMKTELITNVSHDLKTPLTAIITYVNLLKKEDITDEERALYVKTLDQKSQRLKALIEDLFEVSKANSGNVTMNYMDVDIVSLIKQVKSEMSDQIESSSLDFRWNLPDEKIVLSLDGQRTYRVFENLMNNALKYAMPQSRVYVDVLSTQEEVKVVFRNMSAQELSFDPERLTDRFVRGDVSRNSEGSGLGLAIAKSFVELQKGQFKIEVDGDLFKVILTWNR